MNNDDRSNMSAESDLATMLERHQRDVETMTMISPPEQSTNILQEGIAVTSSLQQRLASGRRTKKCNRLPAFLSMVAILAILAVLGIGKNHITMNPTLSVSQKTQLNDGLLYFNVDKKSLGTAVLSHLPKSTYPKGGACISVLVTNRTKDIDEIQVALRSLAFLKGDTDKKNKAPVLVFNEGNLSPLQVQSIVTSTDRPVAFPLVDFSKFPSNFDPFKDEPDFLVKGRVNKWGYYQMIRFWVTGIWEHHALEHFETIMRIDSDSCFKEVNNYLPNFHHEGVWYHSQYVGVEDGAKFVEGLFDFAVNYMNRTRAPHQPRNFLLWDFAQHVNKQYKTLPVFRSNFEVSSKQFMQSDIVRRWHYALTEEEPFGVLSKRWGDAATRFLTAAIFENMDRIFTIRPDGYFHKIGCSREEVDEALKSLKNRN